MVGGRKVRSRRCARTMADEEVRIVGGKRYVRDAGEREVGKWQRWILVDLCVRKEGWSNYKVFRDDPKARKRVYKLAVKDGKVCRGMDRALLAEHHPRAMSWAESKMIWNEMTKG